MTDKGDRKLLRQQIWNCFSRPQLWLFLLIMLAIAEMGYLSMARYWSYDVRMLNLGNMTQAIWSGSQGQPLVFTSQGVPVSRLAYHVELFYFVLAALYRFFPYPEMLLLFQSVLYALGAWPVYRLSKRRLGSSWMGVGLAAMYLLYPVAQTAVLWDIHGDTLAMPLLLFALEAVDRRAWYSYGFWLLLSLSCKVYVAVPVIALGVACWLRGERRVGIWTALIAVAWGAIAFFGIRSVFAPPEATQVAATPASYIERYFSHPSEVVATGGIRLLIALIVCCPAAFLGWRAPLWLLPAAASGLPALLSNDPGPSFVYWYHHYALTVPFFLAASIYGAENRQRRSRDDMGRVVAIAVMVTLLFNAVLVDAPLNPRFYMSENPAGPALGLTSRVYEITSRDRFKDKWLARYIPDGVPVATNMFLAPHIANRSVLYLTYGRYAIRDITDFYDEVDIVAIDALLDVAQVVDDQMIGGGILHDQETTRLLLESTHFGLMRSDDGLLLFEQGGAGLQQTVTKSDDDPVPPLKARLEDIIGLVEADVESLGNGRFRLTYSWVALSPSVRETTYVAVSEPVGLEHALIVHLPTYALLPTSEWPADSVIHESFEFSLPEEAPAGVYPLVVGWYDAAHPFAAETDKRSRLGETIRIGTLRVTE